MAKSILERLKRLETLYKCICNSSPGGTSSQTLRQTLGFGNETNGRDIIINDADSIGLENGSLLRKGTYDFGGFGDVIVNDITNFGDGYIAGIMGWGDPAGTLWSDLNGTYIKTSVAVTPSAYNSGDIGMHTPEPGTFNYYLENPISMGSPNSAWNGIAYFLAPGNRSGWGDPNDNGTADIPVNYWRLCVLADHPFVYFINPSSDPYNFPTSGWVPIDDTIPNNEGGNGYGYIGNYGGGFTAVVSNTLNGNGGISRICSIGYEDNWQAGVRYVFNNSGTIRHATNGFNIIPDSSFDYTKRFIVGSLWTLDNGNTYVCLSNGLNGAVWKLYSSPTPKYKVFTVLVTQSGTDNNQYIYSGELEIGVTYLINDAGGDFTNVGAPNNNPGTHFIATGTTPNFFDGTEIVYNTGAPKAIVLENTIGNIWFTFQNTGQYLVNSDALFTDNKTTVFGGDYNGDSGVWITSNLQSENSVLIFTGDPSYANGYLNNTPIEIRVYN